MAIMSKAQAKNFCEMDDKMIDVMNYLLSKDVVDAKTHRRIMLEGYSKLVDYLQAKKLINAKQAKEAVKGGFDYLLPVLAQ